MKTFRTLKRTFMVCVNEDGTLFITEDGVNSIKDAGALIASYGGVQRILELCDKELSEDELKTLENERRANVHKRMAASQYIREEAQKKEAKEAYDALLLKYPVIPSTIGNIRVVLAYLNTVNWGVWKLPQMTIEYRCNQYDCNGKTATTMVLSEPISEEPYGVKNEWRFVFGNPHGYLTEYQKLL